MKLKRNKGSKLNESRILLLFENYLESQDKETYLLANSNVS